MVFITIDDSNDSVVRAFTRLARQMIRVSSKTMLTLMCDTKMLRGRHGRDRMVVGLKATYAITDVVRSNLDQGEVYNII
jgi:hypothetical protein